MPKYGTHHETCGCFPCGFTGDVFEVSKWLGRSSTFPEAVADVADTLGVYLPQSAAGTPLHPATTTARPTKQPEPPFTLSDANQEMIHALRFGSWGASGLGLAEGWLCYAYPQGLKWRNPDTTAKPRFRWLVGKAVAPWRME